MITLYKDGKTTTKKSQSGADYKMFDFVIFSISLYRNDV